MEKKQRPLVLSCVGCGENMIVESIHEDVAEPVCRECILNSGLPDEVEPCTSVWKCEW